MCSNIVNTTQQRFSYGLAWAKTVFSPWAKNSAAQCFIRTYSMHHWGCCYLQLWATNEDLSVRSRLPPNADVASDLNGSLLLRSSFSTSVHLLPAPPGTEHRLETCSYGSKITEEQWPSLHWTVKIYGGFHRLLWRQEGQWKAISRRKSPRGLAPLRAFPVECIWFAASASSLLMLGKTCGWCPGCSECTCLYSFPAKHSSKKEAS